MRVYVDHNKYKIILKQKNYSDSKCHIKCLFISKQVLCLIEYYAYSNIIQKKVY